MQDILCFRFGVKITFGTTESENKRSSKSENEKCSESKNGSIQNEKKVMKTIDIRDGQNSNPILRQTVEMDPLQIESDIENIENFKIMLNIYDFASVKKKLGDLQKLLCDSKWSYSMIFLLLAASTSTNCDVLSHVDNSQARIPNAIQCFITKQKPRIFKGTTLLFQ